jgi:hypothetical protein
MPSNKPSELWEAYKKGLEDGHHHAQQSHQAGPAHDLGELFNGCYHPPREPELRKAYREGFEDGEQLFWEELLCSPKRK